MSWYISFIGKPEKIAQALKDNSDKVQGQSKVEYDAALPHLLGIVSQNFDKKNEFLLRITASGSGYVLPSGEEQDRSLLVTTERLGGLLLL